MSVIQSAPQDDSDNFVDDFDDLDGPSSSELLELEYELERDDYWADDDRYCDFDPEDYEYESI